MTHRKTGLLLVSMAIGLLGGACSPAKPNSNDVQSAVEATIVVLEADTALEPTQEIALAEPATAAPEAPPTATLSPSPTVAHLTLPGSPAGVHGFLTDRSTAALAPEHRAISDNFETNLFERPFAAEGMEYRPDLDITRAELSKSLPFIYITISLEGPPPAGSLAQYGVEVDNDIDGRGDWLILAATPLDSSWTTEGVRACRDSDEDVGGAMPMRADASGINLNGYDDCVFDSGAGISPDEAWVRLDPDHNNQIQIALLHSLIGSDDKFLWGVWADAGERDPGRFDYQDHFTLAEAGSANSTNSQYPLKGLALVDNTCRWSFGFTLTGSEIGACLAPPTPTAPPWVCVKPSRPSEGWYWDQASCAWIYLN